MARIGIIGGSGFYDLDRLEEMTVLDWADTPFGRPSDQFITGIYEGVSVIFLARHGKGHTISPSEINYRANIFEMKRLGADALISVSACGSLKQEIKPMDFVVPDQFVDRTFKARETSFFTDGIVAHVSFAKPVSKQLSEILVQAAQMAGVTVHKKGTYVNMEGPQFSTLAESNLYRDWGIDIIGMTNMIEAKLAREAELSYATLAAVTDYDCWHPDHESVTVEMIIKNLQENVSNAKKILEIALPMIGKIEKFKDHDALKNAIVTDPNAISDELKKKLTPIIGKYIQ